jgi:hypothetical protein
MDAPAADNASMVLEAALSQLLGPEQLASFAGPFVDESKLLTALASMSRKLGAAQVELPRAAREALQTLGYRPPQPVALAQLARIYLLVQACRPLVPAARLALMTRAYRTAGNPERVALLRALPLLPEPQCFLPIATDACRTHVLEVFEAIACDNPYPALHFDDASFNQLVIKALFVGAQVARIEGLAERRNAELLRMLGDYVSERRAAGRSIPADVALIDPRLGSP